MVKTRRSASKDFVWIGDPKEATLFGQQCWASGGRKVVVCEGEIDAMSMSQVQGNKWPVVSVKDGAAGDLGIEVVLVDHHDRLGEAPLSRVQSLPELQQHIEERLP